MTSSELTTIATYSFPHEAHIARASLEAAGVEAFIADEHTINMDWTYSNALGGVRVRVAEKDAQKAQDILAQDFSHLIEEEFGEDAELSCSMCGSTNMTPHTKGKRPAFLVFLLLGFPLFFHRHGMKCDHCGHFEPD